jgi:hypothetical protein
MSQGEEVGRSAEKLGEMFAGVSSGLADHSIASGHHVALTFLPCTVENSTKPGRAVKV